MSETLGDMVRDAADKLKEAYDEALNDFLDWLLPKIFDLGNLFRDWTGQNRDGKYQSTTSSYWI